MDTSTSGGPGGKRLRERDREAAELSDFEQKKRQKNRDAAKKCRQNKQMEMENLKKNNESLEAKNAELLKKKADLEGKVKNLLQFIREHLDQGCELPPHEAEVWAETWRSLCQMLPSPTTDVTGVGVNTQVAMMVPESPQPSTSPTPNISSGRSAQLVHTSPSPSSMIGNGQYIPCASPLTLFSGVPMTTDQLNNQPSFPIQSPSHSSPSPSPSLSTLSSSPPHRMSGSPVSPIVPGEMTMYQGIVPINGPLAPVRRSSNTVMIHHANVSNIQSLVHMESQVSRESSASVPAQDSVHMESQISTDSSASIPLVVLEEEGIEDPDQELDQSKTQTSDVLRQVREEPEMEVENLYSRYVTSYENNHVFTSTSLHRTDGHASMESTNLGSGGFTLRQDSFPESPQTMPSQEVPHAPKFRGKREQETTHSLNLTAPDLLAPALLNVSEAEMATTLKQQLHSSFSSASQPLGSSTTTEQAVSPSDSLSGCQSSLAMQANHLCRTQQTCQGTTYDMEERGQHQKAVRADFQRQQSRDRNCDVSLPVKTMKGEIVHRQFTNLKYVVKCGHQFVLEETPEGKFKVYELKDNILVDCQYEIQLKDSPQTAQPSTSMDGPSSSPSQSEDAVPALLAQTEDTKVHAQGSDSSSLSDVPMFSQSNCHDEHLPSFKQTQGREDATVDPNLPSLSFQDLNRDDINVFAKKPRGKDSAEVVA